MQPPNLKPQRARLLAPLVAASACLCLASSLSGYTAAYAAELPIVVDQRLLTEPASKSLTNGHHTESGHANIEGGYTGDYAPDFAYLDRSLIGRQAPDIDTLKNNEATQKEIAAGATLHFVLERNQLRLRQLDEAPREALELRGVSNVSGEDDDIDGAEHEASNIEKRQADTQVWLSATTCRQPVPDQEDRRIPNNHPQLVMYVSTSSNNQKPAPDSTDDLATNVTGVIFDSGFGSFDLNTTSDVYIGISAPTLPEGWTGSWQFEIAASTDSPYHSFNDSNPFLFMVDTDSDSALFITAPLDTSNASEVVDKWAQEKPFQMYAFQAGDYTAITGMEHSFCAIKEQFNSNTTKNFTVSSSITTKFDDLPKSQFHVQDLDAAKTYNGFVMVEGTNATAALPGVGVVKAGGRVFQQFNWTTKAGTSCSI